MVLKQFSFDDAMYYRTLKNSSSRDDELITGFNTLRAAGKSVYLALTTKYINMIDEELRTLLIPIHKISRIFSSAPDTVSFEFDTLEVDSGHTGTRSHHSRCRGIQAVC